MVLIAVISPIVSFGQSPYLGTTAQFAIFTSVGAFTSTGATSVTGDIGTNVGAFTGFPPGTVVGQIHVADSASAQAATDAFSLYGSLSTIGCGNVITSPIGNGKILTPGVYCIGGAATLNGNLILDGQGNPDAIFIFQIGGAFSTSALSNITLINSASSSNIYWQIEGAVDLGSSSGFLGTIVADGAISIASGASLEGRALSIGGAISLSDNKVSLSSTSGSPLPIQLLSFTAHEIDGNVQFSWSTASEIGNNYFSIERSLDGVHFEEILRIAGMGNSSSIIYYSAVDHDPYNGISYKRLKQTDFDGKYTYSNIVSVNLEKPLTFSIYPNPFIVNSHITINCLGDIKKAKLCLYNTLGEIITNIPLTDQSTIFKTDNLSPGIYFYILVDNDKIIQSGKLVSQ